MPDRSNERFVVDRLHESYLAHCAPLSRVFSNHLFEHFIKTATFDRDESHRQGNLQTEYQQAFYTVLSQARRQIFTMTNQMHSGGKEGIATDSFLATLPTLQEQNDQAIQPQTLSAWTKARLVRKGFNKIEYHSFAEVLLARMIDNRTKGWLPSSVPAEEPHMWVFYQSPPSLFVDGEWVEQPVQIVPYPLPDDFMLAKAGILWSPWEGLVWDGWTHVETMGAIRFVGQKSLYGRLLWDISIDDLSRWGLDTVASGLGILEQSDEALQNRAHRALLELAMRKLAL